MLIVLLVQMVKTMQDVTKPIFLVDYSWAVEEGGDLRLDPQLHTDSLGWKTGDYFQLKIVDGKKKLVKVDDLELFSNGAKVNGT